MQSAPIFTYNAGVYNNIQQKRNCCKILYVINLSSSLNVNVK